MFEIGYHYCMSALVNTSAATDVAIFQEPLAALPSTALKQISTVESQNAILYLL